MSKRIIFPFSCLALMVLLTCAISAEGGGGSAIIAANFNSGGNINNLGGEFGCWNVDSKDKTQSCKMSYVEAMTESGQRDNILQLDYDVDSPQPAYNGFWMKLKGIDLTNYKYLSFLVKGKENFTSQFKIELKNKKGEKVTYFISGVTERWKKVVVPLENAEGFTDWANIDELNITFDDVLATKKEGTILIDDIVFQKTEKG